MVESAVILQGFSITIRGKTGRLRIWTSSLPRAYSSLGRFLNRELSSQRGLSLCHLGHDSLLRVEGELTLPSVCDGLLRGPRF